MSETYKYQIGDRIIFNGNNVFVDFYRTAFRELDQKEFSGTVTAVAVQDSSENYRILLDAKYSDECPLNSIEHTLCDGKYQFICWPGFFIPETDQLTEINESQMLDAVHDLL